MRVCVHIRVCPSTMGSRDLTQAIRLAQQMLSAARPSHRLSDSWYLENGALRVSSALIHTALR